MAGLSLKSWRSGAVASVALLVASCGGTVIDRTHTETARQLWQEQLTKTQAGRDPLPIPLPIAAPADYRRCAQLISDEEGDVNSLKCSADFATEVILTGAGRRTVPEEQFRQACIRHDLCYEHGIATYGRTRADCDHDMAADMMRLCSMINEDWARPFCQFRGGLVSAAVRLFGWTAYDDLHPTNCDYEHGPQAARDHILTGRLIPGRPAAPPEQLVEIRLESEATLRLTVYRHDTMEVVGSARIDVGGLGVGQAGAVPGACGGKPCLAALASMTGSAFRSTDLLAYRPVLAELTSDGRQTLLFYAPTPQLGLIIVAVTFDETGRARISANAGLGLIPPQSLAPLQEALLHPVLVGNVTRTGDGGGSPQELVLASLAALLEQGIEIRTILFGADAQTADPHQWRMVTETFVDDGWRGATEGGCDGHIELYKRFQYAPRLQDADGDGLAELIVYFRDKCDPYNKLVIGTYRPAEGRGDVFDPGPHWPIHTALHAWPRFAHPILPLDIDLDGRADMVATYLAREETGIGLSILLAPEPKTFVWRRPTWRPQEDAGKRQTVSPSQLFLPVELAGSDRTSNNPPRLRDYFKQPALGGRVGPKGEAGLVWFHQNEQSLRLLKVYRADAGETWCSDQLEGPPIKGGPLQFSPMLLLPRAANLPDRILAIRRSSAPGADGLGPGIEYGRADSTGPGWTLLSRQCIRTGVDIARADAN
ncbi:MAG TPA: hypothetical protein VEH84_06205 [Alphaproteobacteria bacterium]|nr:hypothetical protein [Alphaproteobacteria bacterium]